MKNTSAHWRQDRER